MKEPDKRDLALLAKCSDKEFEFTKGAAMARRAFDLSQHGLLERKLTVYSVGAGMRTAEFRPAYRRTPAGKAAVDGSAKG